jgi:hypothetical protein
MHPKERPVPVLGPLGQPEPQRLDTIRYDSMRLNVYFEKFQKKNKVQRFDSVSSHLGGEDFFGKIFRETLFALGGT